MKKTLIPLLLSALFFSVMSCNKPDDQDEKPEEVADTTNTDTTKEDPKKTNTEILAKKWIVDEAYVNGTTPDGSSKGLKFDIRADGSYTLSTGYIGTWEFIEDETKILWDKSKSFTQTFTLDEFKEDLIDATFVSGFTGQNARWVMIPE